jgi:hypothetical protein
MYTFPLCDIREQDELVQKCNTIAQMRGLDTGFAWPLTAGNVMHGRDSALYCHVYSRLQLCYPAIFLPCALKQNLHYPSTSNKTPPIRCNGRSVGCCQRCR